MCYSFKVARRAFVRRRFRNSYRLATEKVRGSPTSCRRGASGDNWRSLPAGLGGVVARQSGRAPGNRGAAEAAGTIEAGQLVSRPAILRPQPQPKNRKGAGAGGRGSRRSSRGLGAPLGGLDQMPGAAIDDLVHLEFRALIRAPGSSLTRRLHDVSSAIISTGNFT